jgi:hypothetical protein
VFFCGREGSFSGREGHVFNRKRGLIKFLYYLEDFIDRD